MDKLKLTIEDLEERIAPTLCIAPGGELVVENVNGCL